MQLIEEQIFVNSIWKTQLDFDLESLITLVNRLETENFFSEKKISKGLKTENFCSLEHEELESFFEIVSPLVNTVSKQLGISRSLYPTNYWFNIDRRYDYGDAHYHREGIISGVFYIKCPSNTSRIRFERPDNQEHYFEPDIPNERSYRYYTFDAIPNRLLLFPSYIKHSIEQNNTEDFDHRRYSLSFNYNF